MSPFYDSMVEVAYIRISSMEDLKHWQCWCKKHSKFMSRSVSTCSFHVVQIHIPQAQYSHFLLLMQGI